MPTSVPKDQAVSDPKANHEVELSRPLADWLGQLQPVMTRWQEAAEAFQSSPAFQNLRTGILRCAQALAKYHPDSNPQVRELLERLPEWARNLEANSILLDQGIAVLEEAKYRAVWSIFRLKDVVGFAHLEQKEVEQKLYDYSTRAEFEIDVLALYDTTELPSERRSLIQESLVLHRSRYFGGSVALLYSQLEGILGDTLVALGLAEKDGTIRLRPRATDKQLRGVDDKLSLLKTAPDCPEIVTDLLKECIVVGSVELKLAPSRNGVLHGTDSTFANARLSTQLVLWLAALLIQVHALLPLRNRSDLDSPDSSLETEGDKE